MQRISATNRGMGPKVMAGDAAGVAEDLGSLQSLFMAAQTAFIKEKATGPADLAKAAATAAGDAQKVAKSGKVDAATTKAITDSCAGCHTPYRTKNADNTYSIKAQ
jgi:cytochrome c553